jgi:hypothetical protein
LLGMYLGDGCISRTRRTYVLRIFLHRKQVDVIARVYRAIRSLLPDHRVGYVPRRHDASITITSYFNGWPDLLPQHGSGRKHARAIILEPWQAEIVERHSDQFVRGLIESDGCRHRRIVARKDYPAYSFKNHSGDIRNLFTSACRRLGLRPCQANAVTISIARRADVARLDALMGDTAAVGKLLAAVERRDGTADEEVRDGRDLVGDLLDRSS